MANVIDQRYDGYALQNILIAKCAALKSGVFYCHLLFENNISNLKNFRYYNISCKKHLQKADGLKDQCQLLKNIFSFFCL